LGIDRKAKIREYKETPRPAGIYRILNLKTGRSLVGTSVDAPARLNRDRTQLQLRAHPNRALQRDWLEEGAESFSFEVLDLLPPRENADADVAEDLLVLEELWIEKLGLTEATRY
jgi:hypothetical protein